jgi:hypothetical protein
VPRFPAARAQLDDGDDTRGDGNGGGGRATTGWPLRPSVYSLRPGTAPVGWGGSSPQKPTVMVPTEVAFRASKAMARAGPASAAATAPAPRRPYHRYR